MSSFKSLCAFLPVRMRRVFLHSVCLPYCVLRRGVELCGLITSSFVCISIICSEDLALTRHLVFGGPIMGPSGRLDGLETPASGLAATRPPHISSLKEPPFVELSVKSRIIVG